jgi:nonsense-mediated mRNA decay protein 3
LFCTKKNLPTNVSTVTTFISFSDYLEFLDDLEEDPTYRQNVNIFRDKSKQQIAVDADDIGDETIPHITLDEMLDDLNLEDVEMSET